MIQRRRRSALNGLFVLILTYVYKTAAIPARANVSLRMSLNSGLSPRCDETVYKVIVCAGEFTNECRLFGPATRFIQSSCASQGSPEPFNFEVTSVENLIELDVKVRRVGEQSEQQLRPTEFRLTDRSEITVTSSDLNLIVRFYAEYVCLPNYFGKSCDKFCDQKAPEHICDESGNPNCRSGYFWDAKTSSCRLDLCLRMPDYCLNEGTCVPNPNRTADRPSCLCLPGFIGSRCEEKQPDTTTVAPVTTAVTIKHSGEDLLLKATKSNNNPEIVSDRNSKPTRNVYSHFLDRSEKGSEEASSSRGSNAREDHEESDDEAESGLKLGPTVPKTTGLQVKQLTSNDEPRVKRVLLPVLVIILIFALLLVCVGFLVWIGICKGKPKKSDTRKKPIPPATLDFQAPPKRWASVENSPTRYYSFTPGIFPTLPSLNETPFTFFGEPATETTELQCGSPLYPNFQQAPPFPSIDTTSQYAVSGLPDCRWNYDANRIPTLPRSFSTLQRRRTMEPYYPPTTMDSSMIYAASPTTFNNGSFIDPRIRGSTILGPLLPDVTQNFQALDNGPQLLVHPVGSRAPSIHGMYSNKLETTPFSNSCIYSAFFPNGEENPTTAGSVHPEDYQQEQLASSRTPAQQHEEQQQLPEIPPPPVPSPPLQFADTYLSSVC